MTHGYHARIEYDAEIDMFRGDILGLNLAMKRPKRG